MLLILAAGCEKTPAPQEKPAAPASGDAPERTSTPRWTTLDFTDLSALADWVVATDTALPEQAGYKEVSQRIQEDGFLLTPCWEGKNAITTDPIFADPVTVLPAEPGYQYVVTVEGQHLLLRIQFQDPALPATQYADYVEYREAARGVKAVAGQASLEKMREYNSTLIEVFDKELTCFGREQTCFVERAEQSSALYCLYEDYIIWINTTEPDLINEKEPLRILAELTFEKVPLPDAEEARARVAQREKEAAAREEAALAGEAAAGEQGKIWFDDLSWGNITLVDVPYAPRYVFVPRFWYGADGTEAAESRTAVEGDYTFISPETGKRMTDEEIIRKNGDPAMPEWEIDDPSVVQFDFENGILLPQKAGETVFTLRYKGAVCEVPIRVSVVDPLDREALEKEIVRMSLGLDEPQTVVDALHHVGMGNEIALEPTVKFRGCGGVLIPGDEEALSIRIEDEELAALKWVELRGAYTLETYKPGKTKIILSYYGVEKAFPLIVKGDTVKQICSWDAEDSMIEREMEISLPGPGTGYDLPLAAVMSDGSRVSLARQYVTVWENSDPEVADCGTDCTVYAKKPGSCVITCTAFHCTFTIRVTVGNGA